MNEDPNNGLSDPSLIQLYGKKTSKIDNSPSFSTSSSLYQQAIPKQQPKKDLHGSANPCLKGDFSNLNTDVAQLKHKIIQQAHSSLISPRMPIMSSQSKSLMTRDKIMKKINRLNRECFNQSNLFHYINKPMSNLNRPILSFADVRASLQFNSPTKLGIHSKLLSYAIEQFQRKGANDITERSDIKRKANRFSRGFNIDSVHDNTPQPTTKELQRRKDNESLNAYRNFHTEASIKLKSKRSKNGILI